jgi:hypothetical protein
METTALTVSEMEKLLWTTPGGKELLLQRQRQEERERLAAEIAALREEQERELPPLKQAKEEAWQAALAAHKNYKELEAKARGTESAYYAVSSRVAHWITRRENALRNSANPAIDEFIRHCRKAIDAARGSFSSVALPTGDRAFESGRPIVEYRSNADTIERDVRTLEVAINGAEALKLLALTDDEVATRLQQLSETLPADAKQQAWILDDLQELPLMIRERSELVHLSQPGADVKRGLRQSLGIGSFRPLRR